MRTARAPRPSRRAAPAQPVRRPRRDGPAARYQRTPTARQQRTRAVGRATRWRTRAAREAHRGRRARARRREPTRRNRPTFRQAQQWPYPRRRPAPRRAHASPRRAARRAATRSARGAHRPWQRAPSPALPRWRRAQRSPRTPTPARLRSHRAAGAPQQETVDGCLRHIEFLDREIAQVERRIASEALDSAEIRRLMTVPGVNVIAAATFMAAVGDIRRFRTHRQLVGYLDLDPKVRQSRIAPAKSGRISKQRPRAPDICASTRHRRAPTSSLTLAELHAKTPAAAGIDVACPKSAGITPVDHDAVETDATRGDLRPSRIHLRPILRPNYVPKFASKPLTFIGRPKAGACWAPRKWSLSMRSEGILALR